MYTEEFQLLFPLQKINAEKRIVTGIATADNIDLEGDVLDFNASMDAFSCWIGNIREMHDPTKAVGTLVDYRPTTIFRDGKTYNAIEVDVYISKGAEDTWQKILDKTLKGFSVGGKVLERKPSYDEATGQPINLVMKYMLGELSVVDNPCNPAGVFMLIKRAPDGQLVSAVEEKNAVYYCDDHKYATIDDNKFCPICSKEMVVIGFVEEFNAEVINKVISTFELQKKGEKIMDLHENTNDAILSDMDEDFTPEQKDTVLRNLGKLIFSGTASTPTVAVPNVTVNIHKGIMTDDDEVEVVEKPAELVEEKVEEVIVKEVDDKEIEIVAEDAEGEEDMDLEKALEAFGNLLDEKLDKVKADISAEVDAKIETIEKSVSEVKESTDETLLKVTEDIEKVANSGATSKSEVIDEEVDTLEKSAPVKTESFWGNTFLPEGVAEILGYDS